MALDAVTGSPNLNLTAFRLSTTTLDLGVLPDGETPYPINFNGLEITGVFVGATPVASIWIGATQVWP
jgi:hypothetical protein